MNIFAVDLDPNAAAVALCDKHIPRLHTEACLLLAANFPPNTAPWGRKKESSSIYQNKLAKWIRASSSNWDWVTTHIQELINEHRYRYDHETWTPQSQDVLNWCLQNRSLIEIPEGPLTPFALAIAEELLPPGGVRTPDEAVLLYRRYYIEYKNEICRWRKKRPAPEWYNAGLTQFLNSRGETNAG